MGYIKKGQVYRAGDSITFVSVGEIIEIIEVVGKIVTYKNVSRNSERLGYFSLDDSLFCNKLELVYDPTAKTLNDEVKKEKSQSKIVIETNKTKATATIEIGDDYKETIDAENMEITDFIDDVVATFLGAYDIHVLSNKEKYNGKVVCIDPCDCEDMYTLGKIYEFKDGRILDNDGCVIPPIDEEDIADFEEWKNFSSAKWVEVVE